MLLNINARKAGKSIKRKIGLPPGAMVHVGEKKVENARINIIRYNDTAWESLISEDASSPELKISREQKNWINVTGLHDLDLIKTLSDRFNIHPLVSEDILNTEQRSKLEIHGEHIFAVLKLFTWDENEKHVKKDHLGIIIGRNMLMTYQELPDTVFDPLRERLRNGSGKIRSRGHDYLFYSLVDIIIDHYALALEHVHSYTEDLEEEVLDTTDKHFSRRIHRLKNELISFRRSIWPVRDIMSQLLKGGDSLVSDETRMYFRDAADHMTQVAESLESLRERVDGLMDMYLTLVNNRMNEVMKVLTIIATIFIPLSFFAGVYGMNFHYMPELAWKLGYPAFWGISLTVVLVMVNYFRRKRWF